MSLTFVGKPDSRGNISLLCPYHDDHNASASYSIPLGLFYCFTCGAVANKHKLEHEHGELDIAEHTMFTYNPVNWEEQYHVGSIHVSEYAKSRLVTQELAEEYGLRFTEDSVMFPITNNVGQMTGMQVRRVHETPKYLTLLDTEKPMLTPMDIWNPEEPFFIVEGLFGMLRMRQAGYNAYASMGVNMKRKHVNILKMYSDRFAVIFDPDKAGIKGMLSLGYSTGCKVHIGGVEIDNVLPEHVWVHASNVGTVDILAAHLRG